MKEYLDNRVTMEYQTFIRKSYQSLYSDEIIKQNIIAFKLVVSCY